jgi:hypothetical protein
LKELDQPEKIVRGKCSSFFSKTSEDEESFIALKQEKGFRAKKKCVIKP